MRSWARFSSGASLPSVPSNETKRIREGEGRVAGWGCLLVNFAKREKKGEKKKKKW
jgi:hypothetical protein